MESSKNPYVTSHQIAISKKRKWLQFFLQFLALALMSGATFAFGLTVAFDKTSLLTSYAELIIIVAMLFGALAFGSVMTLIVLVLSGWLGDNRNGERLTKRGTVGTHAVYVEPWEPWEPWGHTLLGTVGTHAVYGNRGDTRCLEPWGHTLFRRTVRTVGTWRTVGREPWGHTLFMAAENG